MNDLELARNPNTPAEVLASLAKDEDRHVRRRLMELKKYKRMKEILLKIMESPLWYEGIKTKKGKQISRQHAYLIKMKVQKDMFSEGTLLKYLRMLGEDVQINIGNYAKKTGKNQ